ncbi:unnamed protein product [Boreogadus saida]
MCVRSQGAESGTFVICLPAESAENENDLFTAVVLSNRDISGKVARYERKRIRDEDKAPATCPTSQPEADTVDSSEDECKFVSRKEMHQLNLQYNQLCDDYEALKRELYATQEENKHLKEQLKQSKFGFDSIKDTS